MGGGIARDAAGRRDRTRRHRHALGRPLPGQAAQLAQRRRGGVRRGDLVQRPALRHQHRLRGRQAGLRTTARALPVRPGFGRPDNRVRRVRGAERPVLLARRATPLRVRNGRAVRPRPHRARPRLRRRGRPARERPRVRHDPTRPRDGVHCLDPGATLLGKVRTPAPVSNLAFGGRNRSWLFLCASHALYTIAVNKRGAQVP